MHDQGTEQDDELSFKDFKEQLRKLRLFLKSLLYLVGKNVRQYYLWIVFLLVGFTALGYYQYKNSKSFEAKASFVYIELQKKTYGEMLDKLQDMIKAGSYNKVAQALAIPVNQARSITNISAQNIYGSRLSEDITEKNNLFYVSVAAGDNHLFDSLQYAIEHYLNNNVLVQELLARRSKALQQKIAYLKSELVMLDSLKGACINNLNQSSGSAYPAASQIDLVPLYEKGEKVLHDITDMEALLNDSRAVQTQDRFLVTEEPTGKSALSFALKYAALFLVSCIGLFFLLSIFKK